MGEHCGETRGVGMSKIGRSRTIRWALAAVELLTLSLIVWIANILAQPAPSHGWNAAHFGAVWFAYTYALSTALLILLPTALVTGAAVLGYLIRGRSPSDYCWAYRIGFLVVVTWATIGTYGFWYAS